MVEVAVIDAATGKKLTDTLVKPTSAERGEKGPGGVKTPDGRPIGTITSYCKGQTVCPDWVNNI